MNVFDLRNLAAAAEPRAPMPTGDLRLSDGRWLRYAGRFDGARVGTPEVQAEVWHGPKGLNVLASLDNMRNAGKDWGVLLHVSLSYPDRDPTWADIKAVRAVFYPDTIDVMMILPRATDYVNIHRHAFHMTQTPESWGIL